MKDVLIELALRELLKKFKEGKIGRKLADFLQKPDVEETVRDIYVAYINWMNDNRKANENDGNTQV